MATVGHSFDLGFLAYRTAVCLLCDSVVLEACDGFWEGGGSWVWGRLFEANPLLCVTVRSRNHASELGYGFAMPQIIRFAKFILSPVRQ